MNFLHGFGDNETDALRTDCQQRGGTWYDSSGAGPTSDPAAQWIAPEAPAAPAAPAAPLAPEEPTSVLPSWPWWAWMAVGAVVYSLLKGRRE